MSNRTRPRVLSLSLSIPHTRLSSRVRINARRDLIKQCADEIKQFARRHGVPVSHVDYSTQWGG